MIPLIIYVFMYTYILYIHVINGLIGVLPGESLDLNLLEAGHVLEVCLGQVPRNPRLKLLVRTAREKGLSRGYGDEIYS